MMRDHVAERRVARAQDVRTFAHRTANVHSGTGRMNDHLAQTNTAAEKPLGKNVCQKVGVVVLSIMLALTMMPSAGLAFAAEDALGGGSALNSESASTASVVTQNAPGSSAVISTEGPEDPSGEKSSPSNGGDVVAISASNIINETMPLTTPVAQKESTRSYFLAQTLETTKTISMVSANLPLDTGTTGVDVIGEPLEGTDDNAVETEGGEDSDESDLSALIAPESTVVGSFEHCGITYAVEPGGETVAVVAADYEKLPSSFIEAHTIALPSTVTVDGVDHYSVTRIADYAFASVNEAAANAQSEIGAPRYENSTDNMQDESAELGSAPANREEAPEENTATDDNAVNDDESVTGIIAITIPASVIAIDDDAFTGFDTLRYVIVSADNPSYSMYDGALYSADQTRLLLIPEGRTGAVRISPMTSEATVETFSHHADLTLYVDAGSAAFTSEDDTDTADVTIVTVDEETADEPQALTAAYFESTTAEAGDTIDVAALLNIDEPQNAQVVSSHNAVITDATALLEQPGTDEVALVAAEADTPAFYALHVDVLGDVPATETTAPMSIESATQYNAEPVAYASDENFVHNEENCASGGTVLPGETRAYGWTCPHYQDYVAYEYSSLPGTPGYVWVPNGITPSAHISKQAVEAGEYYLLAGGKFANSGAAGSGGMFPASQVRNDYGKPASAWWEITASKPNASLGTLRIHCDYGTTIIDTFNKINPFITQPKVDLYCYAESLQPKSTVNAWHNVSEFGKIRDVVFDHVDTDSCSGWFQTKPDKWDDPSNLETVTFLGNTAPPSVETMESMFCGAANLYEFSENFTLYGLDALTDVRWMFFECGKLASFPLQFNYPKQLIDAWGWVEDCISIGSLPDAFRSAPGLTDSNVYSKGSHSMKFMFGLNDSAVRKLDKTLSVGNLFRQLKKTTNNARTWYYAGTDSVTLDYLQRGMGSIDHAVIRSNHATWDARGGSFSYTSSSNPYGGSYITDYNCSYVESIYALNGTTATSNLKSTITVPQSPKKGNLHFLGWYRKVPVGITQEQMDKNEKNCVYRWERLPEPYGSGFNDNSHTMANPGKTTFYYALYGEDEFVSDIVFDLNTGEGTAPATIEDQTADVAMRQPMIDVSGIYKPGYIFDGFWSDKVGGKQYYDKNGVASDNIRWTEAGPEKEVKLYAHWKYKVYLDLNTYNTDNQLVLNSTTSTNSSGTWVQSSGAQLELTPYLLDTQTGLIADPTPHIQNGVMVEGASGAQQVRTTRYYIEATQGAPIDLPKVKDRTGYGETFEWGLEVPAQRNGSATSIVATQDKNGYLTNDDALASAYAALVEDNPDYDPATDDGITLYANWVGKANAYWVQLQSAYETDKAPADKFTTATNATQFVQVTYDQPISLSGVQVPVETSTVTSNVTGMKSPRNLRLAGFRTQPNSLKTNDGKEYITVSDGALAASVKFRETNSGSADTVVTLASIPDVGYQSVVVLYAKWLYPEVKVTVDLQSGALDDPTVQPAFTVSTTDPVPNLEAGTNGIPCRPGFTFTGYWTTKYTEQPGTFETIDDAIVETKQCYKPNSSGTAVIPVGDASWTSYNPTDTLYAHWQYKIYLNTNEWYLGATKAEHQATFGSASNLQTDAHGAYIVAMVGEPIQLPEVTGRTGYKDDASVNKSAWGVRAGKYGSATGLLPLDSNGTFTTADTAEGWLGLPEGKALDLSNATSKSAWGEDLFSAEAQNTAFPQPEANKQRQLEDGSWVDNPEYGSITLFLNWVERPQQYTITLVAAYDDNANRVTYGAENGYTTSLTAQYDAPLLKELSNGDVVTTVGERHVTAPTYKKVPKNGFTAHDNQVFAGYYDAITGGTQYIAAAPEGDGSTTAMVMTPALTGTDSAPYAVPFRATADQTLYARWVMPVCQVTFDMNDGKVLRNGSELSSVPNAFAIKSGDALPRFGATNTAKYGETDTAFLNTKPYYRTTSTIGSDYVFAGYYDAPVGGKRYYTADCEPVASISAWDKYANVTLYAHWTYTVELNLAATSPQAGMVDSLQVLGGTPAVITNANGKHVVTLTYGADATVPATKAAVMRLRSEAGAGGTAKPKQQTGYAFNGWYDAETGGSQVWAAGSNMELSSTNKKLLVPQNGVARLYARWNAVEYPVVFDHTSAGTFSKVENFRTNDEGEPIYGIGNTTVAYDGLLMSTTESVAAPQLMGWTFTGYWTKPQLATDVNDTASDKGTQYAMPLPGDSTRMVGVNNTLWTETSDDSDIVLYAHYARCPYTISFDVNAGADSVSFVSGGTATNSNINTKAAYFDMELATASTARTLKRTGYSFKGWAACENYDAYQALSETEKEAALFYTEDGAAVSGKRYRVEGDTQLHALWKPKSFELAWNLNYATDDGATIWQTTQQNYGDPLVFPKGENGEGPLRIGYDFVGWYDSTASNAKKLSEGDPFKPLNVEAAGMTYYAKWLITNYSFTLLPGAHGSFNASGESGVDSTTGWFTKTYTTKTTPDKFLQPANSPGWSFDGWEELREGADPNSNDYATTELSSAGALTAERLKTEPWVYDGKYFRAKWTTRDYTLTLDADGAELPSGWTQTMPLTVEFAADLPELAKSGYTFQGWYADGTSYEQDDAPVTRVEGATSNVTLKANFSLNTYELRFVQGSSPAMKVIRVADSQFVTLDSETVTVPVPTRRDTFATESAAKGETTCSVFRRFVITDKEGVEYTYRPGDTISIAMLIDNMNDSETGAEPVDGGVFTFVATWNSTYSVAVPLQVEIAFDREHLEKEPVVGEHYIEITPNSDGVDTIEVAQLICEPVSTVGDKLGTIDTFTGDGAKATDLSEFATLTLAAGSKTNPQVRMPMTAVKDGMRITQVSDQSANPATAKTLGDAGFRLGGIDAGAVRKLPLHFNLEFANGFDATRLTAFDAIRDTGVAYPIAKMYYVLMLSL